MLAWDGHYSVIYVWVPYLVNGFETYSSLGLGHDQVHISNLDRYKSKQIYNSEQYIYIYMYLNQTPCFCDSTYG